MANYSKQREVVLNTVKSVSSHPTVQHIYNMAKEKIPNISLGTVYRNLSSLSKEGKINALMLNDGTMRYDGNQDPHIHLICRHCGSIEDVFAENGTDILNKSAQIKGFKADRGVYVLYGICKNCQGQ